MILGWNPQNIYLFFANHSTIAFSAAVISFLFLTEPCNSTRSVSSQISVTVSSPQQQSLALCHQFEYNKLHIIVLVNSCHSCITVVVSDFQGKELSQSPDAVT